MPRRTVAVAGPEIAGIDGDEVNHGGWSLGDHRMGATACKRAFYCASDELRDAASMLGTGAGPNGHRSCVGDELMRRCATVIKGAMAMASNQSGEKRGSA